MTDLSQEELLEELKYAFFDSINQAINEKTLEKFIERRKQAYSQIRKLIQRKVGREFVEKIANEIGDRRYDDDLTFNQTVELLIDMLKKLGYKLEK